jgi:hypothetical protein
MEYLLHVQEVCCLNRTPKASFNERIFAVFAGPHGGLCPPKGPRDTKLRNMKPRDLRSWGRGIAYYTVAILAMSVLSKPNFSVTYCSQIHRTELLTHENNPLKEECKINNIQKSILYLTVKTPLFQNGDHYCNSI